MMGKMSPPPHSGLPPAGRIAGRPTRRRPVWPRGGGRGLALLVLLLLPAPLPAQAGKGLRVSSPGSIVAIPAATQGEPASPHRPRIVRTALSEAETSAALDFEVALRMRNFAELQTRVQRGEIISRDEMAARYFPLAADYEAVVAWVTAQGLTITHEDPSHLSVFVRGTVNQIRQVFQVTFARVAYEGGEYTSAVTAPAVPTSLATALLGINGLQPHLRAHKMTAASDLRPLSLTSNAPPYLPAQILKAYSANGLSVTGVGQTIAIVIDTFPANSDLTTFWTQCNVSQSLSNIQEIQVVSGSLAGIDATEATIDVELTSSIAPGAKLRVYATTDLAPSNLSRAYQQVYDDLPANPTLHQVDLSFGINENLISFSQRQSDAQHFAALAGAGVTVFASSGDGGSNPSASTGGYSASAAAQPSHPASDPSVTGVGATTLTLDPGSGGRVRRDRLVGRQHPRRSRRQRRRDQPLFHPAGLADGPGRAGRNDAAGARRGGGRAIPAPAATSSSTAAAPRSTAAPASAPPSGPASARCSTRPGPARALPPLGLFGPKIYPLIGTTSLRDITSGNNGAYTAGPGYDLVTGVGAPNMPALAQASRRRPSAPQIHASP